MTVWECQLKPKICAETLEGIALLLEKTQLNRLKKTTRKPYLQPQQEILLVAEKKVSYGNQDAEE